MDPEEYHRILSGLADFQDLDTSTIASTRSSLVELKDRRDQLLEIKKELKKDIRGVERYYLDRMAEIRSDVEELREGSSGLRRIIAGNPAAAQARAMKQLKRNRESLVRTYRDLLEYTEELIEYIDDLMIELYEEIKSFFG
ncbi:MAG: RIPOR family protein [Methanothermobacter sp.]|jgi:transposase|nr:RIPOR family protein [Methanothermobacter sp.]